MEDKDRPVINEYTKPKITGSFELFKPSKAAVFLNLESFIILTILPMTYLLYLSSLFEPANQQQATLPDNLLLQAVLAAGVPLFLVLVPVMPYLQLTSAKARHINLLQAVRRGLKYFWRIHIINFLVALAVAVGFLFFIIPGIILLRRYFLSPFYAIDQNLGPLQAMRKSAQETKAHSASVYGVLGVILLISLVGIVPNVGGQLISSVLAFLYSCAPAIRYLQISKLKQVS